MSWKSLNKNSLADSLLVEHASIYELDGLKKMINWSEIGKQLGVIYSSEKGSPSYPPLQMFRILLLQSWYNLSDEGVEKQLGRDLMFRRFVELSLSESVPDHSSIWRFRDQLLKKNLLEVLLFEINKDLEKQGISVLKGSVNIVDATVIEAKQCRKKKGKSGENTQDPEASYNRKKSSSGQEKTTYGFKMHINTDEDGLIKKVSYTTGRVHDSKELENLLDFKEGKSVGRVYADSAYANGKNDEKLGAENNKILHRAYRNKPLSREQKQENQVNSSVRYVVERTFGLLKQHHGLGKARYLGIQRNKARAFLIAMTHNLKTAMNIFQNMFKIRESYP